MGVAVASEALQLHGGMGYVEETGAAQHYRDARIAPIYEGTNAIQAIDLMGRKLGLADGAGLRALLADVRTTAAALSASDDAWLHGPGERLATAADAAETATDWLIERKGHARPDALSGATAYLTLLGDLAGGWLLGRGALASARLEGRAYAHAKVAMLRLYADETLARAPGWCAAVTAGATALHGVTAEALLG